MSSANMLATDESVTTRINYRSWLWRVIALDGLLPLVMWSAPIIVCWLVEDDEGDGQEASLAMTAIFLSLGALCLRFWHGTKHIGSNHCGKNFRAVQFLCFIAGIAFLWLTDMLAISCYDVWKESFDSVQEVIVFLSIWYAIYLPFMVVAMYPGREPKATKAVRLGNWDVQN